MVATLFTIVSTTHTHCLGMKERHNFLLSALPSLIFYRVTIFPLHPLMKRLRLIGLINVCPWCVWPSIICGRDYASSNDSNVIYAVAHYCVSVPLHRQSHQGEGSAGMKMMMKMVPSEEGAEQMNNSTGK